MELCNLDLLCQLNDVLHSFLDTFHLKLGFKASMFTLGGLGGGLTYGYYVTRVTGRSYEEGVAEGREEIIQAAEMWVKNKKKAYPYKPKVEGDK